MAYIKLFTKVPSGEEEPSALAYSVFIAVSKDGRDYSVLNQDYGMLYTRSVVNDDNVIVEKGVISPYMFRRKEGGYGFAAVRVDSDGSIDETADGLYQYWTSPDLVSFFDNGMNTAAQISGDSGINADEFISVMDELVSRSNQFISFDNLDHTSEYIYELPEDDIDEMVKIWNPIYSIGIDIQDNINISSVKDIEDIKAVVRYSDGSTHIKNVKWDTENAEQVLSGISQNAGSSQNATELKFNGMVEHPLYKFPLACGYADPVCYQYNNKWYFIATNDNTDDVGLFVREADRIEDLFAPDVKEHIILDRDEERELIQTFWAPEFHMIGGELYILFAVGPKNWGPQCHMMKLKKGGSITDADSWEDPVRVCKKDGSFLCTNGITLDMTYVRVKDRSYLIWSERYKIGTPLDSGSMIYIAETDENNPVKLISDPVLLTRPLYGWENQYGTINNEGPYALYTEDRLYVAYSGGSAGGYSYVVGFLSIPYDKNLLDINDWHKDMIPSLTPHSVEGEYGPGHNSFYTDENGDVWIAYHAKEKKGWATRCSAIRRVHFDRNKTPVLNMSYDRDLAPEFRKVSITVNIQDGR